MVMAIKEIKSQLSPGMNMNFHNFEDNKDINLSDNQTVGTNTWVPYQSSSKQIRVQVKLQGSVISEFYLWDDNYKLVCSASAGLDTILTVSGNRDIGITVTGGGIQAHLR